MTSFIGRVGQNWSHISWSQISWSHNWSQISCFCSELFILPPHQTSRTCHNCSSWGWQQVLVAKSNHLFHLSLFCGEISFDTTYSLYCTCYNFFVFNLNPISHQIKVNLPKSLNSLYAYFSDFRLRHMFCWFEELLLLTHLISERVEATIRPFIDTSNHKEC